MSDANLHAVLAIEAALGEASRQRILARFATSNLNGAAVADILDILDDSDGLLNLREPFYDGGAVEEVRFQLGWPSDAEEARDYDAMLRRRLIGHAVLAVALLTSAVPTPGPVVRLTRAAADLAAARWPGGQYV